MSKSIGTIGRMWADTVYANFADSLGDMRALSQQYLCDDEHHIDYKAASVSWHELGRKELVDEATGDWLLMLDTDHVFAPDLLIRLLELKRKYDVPVISGIYQYKHPPHSPVANLWTPEGRLTKLLDWDREGEIMEVGSVGAGCLLVDREVFKTIKEKLGEDPFGIRPGLSEDYSFCLRCKELGIPVNLALKVECHHITRNILSVRDYKGNPSEAVPVNFDKGIIQK